MATLGPGDYGAANFEVDELKSKSEEDLGLATMEELNQCWKEFQDLPSSNDGTPCSGLEGGEGAFSLEGSTKTAVTNVRNSDWRSSAVDSQSLHEMSTSGTDRLLSSNLSAEPATNPAGFLEVDARDLAVAGSLGDSETETVQALQAGSTPGQSYGAIYRGKADEVLDQPGPSAENCWPQQGGAGESTRELQQQLHAILQQQRVLILNFQQLEAYKQALLQTSDLSAFNDISTTPAGQSLLSSMPTALNSNFKVAQQPGVAKHGADKFSTTDQLSLAPDMLEGAYAKSKHLVGNCNQQSISFTQPQRLGLKVDMSAQSDAGRLPLLAGQQLPRVPSNEFVPCTAGGLPEGYVRLKDENQLSAGPEFRGPIFTEMALGPLPQVTDTTANAGGAYSNPGPSVPGHVMQNMLSAATPECPSGLPLGSVNAQQQQPPQAGGNLLKFLPRCTTADDGAQDVKQEWIAEANGQEFLAGPKSNVEQGRFHQNHASHTCEKKQAPVTVAFKASEVVRAAKQQIGQIAPDTRQHIMDNLYSLSRKASIGKVADGSNSCRNPVLSTICRAALMSSGDAL